MPAPTGRQLSVLRLLHAGAALHLDARGIGTLIYDVTTLRRSTVEQLHEAGWIAPTASHTYSITEAGRENVRVRDDIARFISDARQEITQ